MPLSPFAFVKHDLIKAKMILYIDHGSEYFSHAFQRIMLLLKYEFLLVLSSLTCSLNAVGATTRMIGRTACTSRPRRRSQGWSLTAAVKP